MEEIGCEIKIVAELGKIIEHSDKWRQIQTSYCYLAKQVGEQRQNSLTDKEREEGLEIIWAKNLDDAIAKLNADSPGGYDGKRMKPRDLSTGQVTPPLQSVVDAIRCSISSPSTADPSATGLGT
ncbi:MAG TPA: hypothetical protein VFT87_05190 [Candidatus Saccharimonadales bacterium]|nr:hypothetical protein [Candidatus Saccharimonadales bacterium]